MSEQEKNAQFGAESLSDERRVKVLSPTMLVMKRFIRNRLAITGLVILIVMFLFSFLGGVLMPYTQSQVFKTYGSMDKDYASATVNQELRYTMGRTGQSFPASARAAFVLAKEQGPDLLLRRGRTHTPSCQSGEGFYLIGHFEKLASAIALKGKFNYAKGSSDLSDRAQGGVRAGRIFQRTVRPALTLDGATYSDHPRGQERGAGPRPRTVALASMLVFDAYNQADEAAVGVLGFKRRGADGHRREPILL